MVKGIRVTLTERQLFKINELVKDGYFATRSDLIRRAIDNFLSTIKKEDD